MQETEGKAVRYSTNNESAILVTKSEDLIIVLPASENGPATYIDVPINDINHVTVATLEESSQLSPVMDRTVVALSIQMSPTSGSSCYINALRRYTKSIQIAFDSVEAAQSVERSLVADRNRDVVHQLASQSAYGINVSQIDDYELGDSAMADRNVADIEHLGEMVPLGGDVGLTGPPSKEPLVSRSAKEIDVSQIHIDGTGGNNGTRDSLQGPEVLTATASHATALLPSDTLLEVQNSRQLRATHTQNVEFLVRRETQVIAVNGPSLALPGRMASVSPGIPVFPEHPVEEKSYQSAKRLEDTSEAGLQSTAQRRRDRQLIDRAREFDNAPTESKNLQIVQEGVQPIIDIPFPPKDEDHDSLYAASPKAPKAVPEPAKLPAEQNSKKDIPKSKTYSKLSQSLSKRLTQRMRNDEGVATTEMSTPIRPKNIPPSRNAKTLDTLKKPSSRGKIPELGTTNTGRHIQSTRRQGKKKGGFSKGSAHESATAVAFDEFDIPDSPPQPQGRRKPIPEASATKQNTTKSNTQIGKRKLPSKIPVPSTSSSNFPSRTQAGNLLKSHQATSTRKNQPKPKAKSADAVNWDEDLDVDGAEVEGTSSCGKRKAAKSKPASAAKGKSANAHANSTKKRAVTGKANAAPLNQPRTRRAAALTANKKIQGFTESNASEKDEPLGTQPLKRKGKTSMAREKEPSKTSQSPESPRSLGSVAQDVVPDVTPSTSLNNQQTDDHIRSASKPPEKTRPLAPSADPKTSPSDEIILVNEVKIYQNVVEVNQDALNQNGLGTTSHKLDTSSPLENHAQGLALGADIDTGEPVFLAVENSHFQDAMTFSASNGIRSSKSPIQEAKHRSPAVDNTSNIKASALRHNNDHNQNSENLDKIVTTSASNSGEPWASKLTGALMTVPKVIEIHSPQSARKLAEQNRTQQQSHSSTKDAASGPTSKTVKTEGSRRGISPTSLPYPKGYQKRDEQPVRDRKGAGTGKARNRENRPQTTIVDRNPATDAPQASPAVSPASRIPVTKPPEVIQIFSAAEDSSDESLLHDWEVINKKTVDQPRVLDSRVAEHSTVPQSVTQSRSQRPHMREAENTKPRSSKAIIDTSPKTHLGGMEPHQHTPAPNRKSNLISFSAKGPRNQGIASSLRPQISESTERQIRRTPQYKKLQAHELEDENQDICRVLPKSPTLIETHSMPPTRGNQARDTASTQGERPGSKLISKLRKAMPTTTLDEIPITLPPIEGTPKNEPSVNDQLDVENPAIMSVGTATTVAAKPSVAVANMGHNSGADTRRHGDKASTKISHAVPVKLSSTTLVGGSRRSSQVTSQPVDAAPRETKRQADEFSTDVLNEVALGKRRKLSTKAPFTGKTIPISVLKRSSSLERDFLQRTGSQSTRVDENGSPLPFVHSREVDVAGSQPRLTQDIVRLPIKPRPNRDERVEPPLPNNEAELDNSKTTLHQGSKPPLVRKWPLGSSGNSKLQPSSPNASSSIVDEMEPHHIHASGEFVNVETENVIISHEPPDPFVGTAKGQSNTFMEALRRTNDPRKVHVKGQKIAVADVRKAPRMIAFTEGDDEDEEDLEITLVEPGFQEEHSDTASQTSSTSQDSDPQGGAPSGDRSGSADHSEEQGEWRKALQTHHSNTLDVLYDISHVSSSSLFPPMIHNTELNPSTSSATLSPKKPQSWISSTITSVAANVCSVDSRTHVKKNLSTIKVATVI